MARIEKRSAIKQSVSFGALPFTKTNYLIFGAALLSIVLGYAALGQDPWDGSTPLNVAPILLVLGYCVLVPLAVLYRGKAKKDPGTQKIESQP